MHVLPASPLNSVEEWDDYVRSRYRTDKSEDEFRSYDDAPEGVKELYRQNHAGQTLAFVQSKRQEYTPPRRDRAQARRRPRG